MYDTTRDAILTCARKPTWVSSIYHHAKFYPNRFRGFGSAHVWCRALRHKMTRLFFGSWERLQPRHARRFWHKIRQTTRFRARKCLLGVTKPKPKVYIPILSKNRHFGPYRVDFSSFAAFKQTIEQIDFSQFLFGYDNWTCIGRVTML